MHEVKRVLPVLNFFRNIFGQNSVFITRILIFLVFNTERGDTLKATAQFAKYLFYIIYGTNIKGTILMLHV